jgi:multidrug efflux pump subunit AcrA (membrane-fusion protein)
MESVPLKPHSSPTRSRRGLPPLVIIIIAFVILVAVIAGTLMFRFANMPKGGFEMVAPVKTAAVTESRLPLYYETVGSLEADRQVDLKPETPGIIRGRYYTEGQWVQQGQKLLRLDYDKQYSAMEESQSNTQQAQAMLTSMTADYQASEASVQEALAKRDLAQTEYGRYKNLWDKDFVSSQDLDLRKSALAVAQANYTAALKQKESFQAKLTQARSGIQSAEARNRNSYANLSDTLIRAPFSGQIGAKHVEVGDYVLPGQKMATLVASNPLKITFGVPERYLNQLRQNLTVELRTESMPDKVFQGNVVFVDPVVALDTRSVMVKAEVNNSAHLLQPGQYANIRLILGEKPNAILVPEESLIPQGERYYVYIVENGKAAFKQVQVGQRIPGKAEILSGIRLKDHVIIGGIQKVQDGAAVKETATGTDKESEEAYETFKKGQQ